MRKLLIGLICLSSISVFANNDCIERELNMMDQQVEGFKKDMVEKYGEDSVNQSDLEAYRDDLQSVVKIKARTCLKIEVRNNPFSKVQFSTEFKGVQLFPILR